MRRWILLLIACLLFLGACATMNEGPPTVIYPDEKDDPLDYNPMQR